MIITKCIITYTLLSIINFSKLTAGFLLKSFKIHSFFLFVFGFWSCIYHNFFLSFQHVLQGQSCGLQSFFFQIFKLSPCFNSAGTSFPRNAPIVITVSKPNVLVLMFHLFTIAPGLRLQELSSLKVNILFIMGRETLIFILHIFVCKYFIFL